MTSCWEVDSFYGYSLQDAVKFVSVATIVSALVTVIFCASHDSMYSYKMREPVHPLVVHGWYFCMIAVCFSFYQILLSMLLLWQSLDGAPRIFFSSLWYISHVGVMFIYGLLHASKIILCVIYKQYLNCVFTSIVSVVHQYIFVRFCIIVNSYLHSLEDDRYM